MYGASGKLLFNIVCLYILPRKWKQQIYPKHTQSPTSPHSIITHNALHSNAKNFSGVHTSNIIINQICKNVLSELISE